MANNDSQLTYSDKQVRTKTSCTHSAAVGGHLLRSTHSKFMSMKYISKWAYFHEVFLLTVVCLIQWLDCLKIENRIVYNVEFNHASFSLWDIITNSSKPIVAKTFLEVLMRDSYRLDLLPAHIPLMPFATISLLWNILVGIYHCTLDPPTRVTHFQWCFFHHKVSLVKAAQHIIPSSF